MTKRFLVAYGEQCPGLFVKHITLADIAADLATNYPYFDGGSVEVFDKIEVGETLEGFSGYFELAVRLKDAE